MGSWKSNAQVYGIIGSLGYLNCAKHLPKHNDTTIIFMIGQLAYRYWVKR